jgi:simple sugar transport system permease protein
VGWIVGVVATAILGPGTPLPLFGITLPLLIALGAALLAGMLLSLLHAWLSISVRVDQIISGTIINIAAVGLTGYLNTLISQLSPQGAGSFQPLALPAGVVDIPVIGWLLNAVFDQGPIGISAIVLVVVMQILLFRSRWGLRTRAVGEHPKAAETVGIDVIRLRYRNVVLSGAVAALGGAYLSMEITNSFQANMTAGRSGARRERRPRRGGGPRPGPPGGRGSPGCALRPPGPSLLVPALRSPLRARRAGRPPPGGCSCR